MPTETGFPKSRTPIVSASLDQANFRAIPGCPVLHGGATFYRCRNLFSPSPALRLIIKESRIKAVIDLRVEKEIASFPDDLSFLEENGILYKNCPIHDILHCGNTEVLSEDLFLDYQDILLGHTEEIRSVFQALAFLSKPVLFHCNAGKDRTGVIALLLEDLFGVDRQGKRCDYEKTERNRWAMRKGGLPDHSKNLPDVFLHATGETIEKTMALLERLGGAKAYLLSTGVAEAELENIKRGE